MAPSTREPVSCALRERVRWGAYTSTRQRDMDAWRCLPERRKGLRDNELTSRNGAACTPACRSWKRPGMAPWTPPPRPGRPHRAAPKLPHEPRQSSRGPSGRLSLVLLNPGSRVARGAYAPPALTEPDLWAHIRLFGTPTFRTAPVVRCRCFHPQLSQIQRELARADDGLGA
jgi:hypothetical protein